MINDECSRISLRPRYGTTKRSTTETANEMRGRDASASMRFSSRNPRSEIRSDPEPIQNLSTGTCCRRRACVACVSPTPTNNRHNRLVTVSRELPPSWDWDWRTEMMLDAKFNLFAHAVDTPHWFHILLQSSLPRDLVPRNI